MRHSPNVSAELSTQWACDDRRWCFGLLAPMNDDRRLTFRTCLAASDASEVPGHAACLCLLLWLNVTSQSCCISHLWLLTKITTVNENKWKKESNLYIVGLFRVSMAEKDTQTLVWTKLRREENHICESDVRVAACPANIYASCKTPGSKLKTMFRPQPTPNALLIHVVFQS